MIEVDTYALPYRQDDHKGAMMMTATFTADMIPADACLSQVDLFCETFPDGAPMTIETAVSVADKFYWDWIARRTLKGRYLKDYEAARVPIDAAYKAALAPIDTAYKAALAPIFAEIYIAQVSQ